MLNRPMRNIIECSSDAADKSCRMGADNRFKVLGQKGVTLWMTGLSGAGKTTITKALEKRLLLAMGKNVYNIDGDNLRTGLTRDLGFSADDRAESVRRASEVAQLFSEAGVVTVVSLISPYRKDRDEARAAHKQRGIPFLEVFMDVPLSVVKARDPKGLYKKVAAGMIKNFTGIDSPYEPPLSPEVVLKNAEVPVEQCVDVLIAELRRRGFLSGAPDAASGLASPDGGELVNLIVPQDQLPTKLAEAASLPSVPLTDLDVNWLQVIGEGWAAPLKGFMREGTLVQALHFNSMLVDQSNFTGLGGYTTQATNWMQEDFPSERVSMPVPIVLPITDFTRRAIGKAKAVALTNSAGVPLAILRNPETYELRVRELIFRTWGIVDDEHPYIKELLAPGKDFALGGEVELLGRITYGDGLDAYRLTVDELRAAFKKKGADTVYAFQTRNPTHAGHAFLMKDSRKKLIARGFKNPVLWLSPLGGWTKASDVPLDVRVSQHKEVMAAGELHPDWTVMGIWPSPMIYAGPREVLFHAKSRRVGGASFFTVGRDPAGMPYSSEPYYSKGDLEGEDLYHADHGRYVLMSSPGVGTMKFLGFEKVYYDKQTHTMRSKDKSRSDDFISISGSKMRKLAAVGAKPCPLQIPSDLIAAKCIPPGFMVEKGWSIVSDYYMRQKTGDWVPYSKQLGGLAVAPNLRTSAERPYGKAAFAAHFVGKDGVTPVSPWHDLSLYPEGGAAAGLVNFVCEIPKGVTAKLEVQKKLANNPIMQDTKKGKLRYYTYGPTFFNYGMLPQTWEDPSKKGFNGTVGDNDPLDVMEIGSKPFKVGEMRVVKVLGDLELIDQGELDHKIIVIDAADPLAARLSSAADLPTVMPGVLENLIEWLKFYKTTDGKAVNQLASDTPISPAGAAKVIAECHESWKALKARGAGDTGFWLK
jgi:3'-phosphoadenosine 5'-phosphosulfate synthase